MFANYQKRSRISPFIGDSLSYVAGFEQIVTNGIPTYYVLVNIGFVTRVYQFDQYWNNQKNFMFTLQNSWNLRYVNGYFYIAANKRFYKTDTNFTTNASYNNSNAFYRSIYYDSSSRLFYVAGNSSQGISIFDTNCNFQRYMTLGGYSPSQALSHFNGYLYGDYGTSIIVASKATGAFAAKYNTLCSNYISYITIDSFGYMAVSCGDYNRLIYLYNAYNGTYLNQQLASSYTYFTAVDSSGRFVSTSEFLINIYY